MSDVALEVDDDVEIETEAPDPDALKRSPDPQGVPLEIDGRTWVLADGRLARDLDELRDEVFDGATIQGTVNLDGIRAAAFLMLRANYQLSESEAAALVYSAEPDALADAVFRSLIVVGGGRRWGYTDWVRSALISNGLEPKSIALSDLAATVRQLVLTGKAAPQDEFISSAAHVAKRDKFDDLTR